MIFTLITRISTPVCRKYILKEFYPIKTCIDEILKIFKKMCFCRIIRIIGQAGKTLKANLHQAKTR